MNIFRDDSDKAWHLIQCKPRQDERAQEHLEHQGYHCYRPTHRQERLSRGKRQLVECSLFPSYLFLQLGPLDNWAPLRSTRGVARIVSFGGRPVPVPDTLIACLRQQESTLRPSELLKAGAPVRITAGPLADVEGIFMSMDGDERVVLLLQILQREQKVVVPLKEVAYA